MSAAIRPDKPDNGPDNLSALTCPFFVSIEALGMRLEG